MVKDIDVITQRITHLESQIEMAITEKDKSIEALREKIDHLEANTNLKEVLEILPKMMMNTTFTSIQEKNSYLLAWILLILKSST